MPASRSTPCRPWSIEGLSGNPILPWISEPGASMAPLGIQAFLEEMPSGLDRPCELSRPLHFSSLRRTGRGRSELGRGPAGPAKTAGSKRASRLLIG